MGPPSRCWMQPLCAAQQLWMWLEMEHSQVWDGGEQLWAQRCSTAPPSASPHVPWALGSPQGPAVVLPTSVTLCSHHLRSLEAAPRAPFHCTVTPQTDLCSPHNDDPKALWSPQGVSCGPFIPP